jgi:hypothetical protein
LSCTDCHEPHGSPNKWLLRTTVNSKIGLSVSSGSDWWDFCTACHTSSHNPGSCSACHLHGGDPGL